MEYPPHAQRLAQATGVLEGLQGRVVIDEIQRKPELFPLLRVLMDRSNAPGQFLLLGSASPSLLRQAGESLLGRIETVEVGGFDLQEACLQNGEWNASAAQTLWLRGGFPLSYLACNGQRQHGLAAQRHCQSCASGLAAIWSECGTTHDDAVLEYVGPFPRAGLVGVASSEVHGCVRANGETLSGRADPNHDGAPAATVA